MSEPTQGQSATGTDYPKMWPQATEDLTTSVNRSVEPFELQCDGSSQISASLYQAVKAGLQSRFSGFFLCGQPFSRNWPWFLGNRQLDWRSYRQDWRTRDLFDN